MPQSMAARLTPLPRTNARDAAPSVEIVTNLGAIEAEWRAFEKIAVASPFQNFDFVAAYATHVLAGAGERVAIALQRSPDGSLRLLLPLVVGRRGPVRLARSFGDSHASYHLPLFAAGAVFAPEEMTNWLTAVGRALAVDAIVLRHQPETFEGQRNPLAALAPRRGGNDCYRLDLEPDGPALIARRISKDSRKKLARKAKKLAELGPVRMVQARTNAEVEAMLAFFFRHRALRFAKQGIADPFAAPPMRAFFADAAQFPPGGGQPALTLFALQAGARIVGMFGAACNGRRFSGMVTAFDMAPEIERHSPGEHLLMALVLDHCAKGYRAFDLGAGAARYKTSYCDQIEPLFEGALPITPLGRALAMAIDAKDTLRAAMKRSPKMMSLVQRWRRWRSRLV